MRSISRAGKEFDDDDDDNNNNIAKRLKEKGADGWTNKHWIEKKSNYYNFRFCRVSLMMDPCYSNSYIHGHGYSIIIIFSVIFIFVIIISILLSMVCCFTGGFTATVIAVLIFIPSIIATSYPKSLPVFKAVAIIRNRIWRQVRK